MRLMDASNLASHLYIYCILYVSTVSLLQHQGISSVSSAAKGKVVS